MTKILYIQASPSGEESYSIATANTFIEKYTQLHPNASLEVMNLFEAGLPPYDASAVVGRLAAKKDELLDQETKKAWERIEKITKHFMAADVYVFAIPMWNFSIPYILKHYLDVILQPGFTFGADEKGYFGLLKDKKAFVAYSRGGEYCGTPVESWDQQTVYVNFVLNLMEINIEKVIIEPCRMGRELAKTALANAKEEALKIAEKF